MSYTASWPLDLRTGEFLDDEPDPADVPKAVRKVIDQSWATLCAKWDEMYPENPVRSEDEGTDDD